MILLDVCELIVDCPHSTAQDEGAGYPLIRTPNVGKGRLILDGVHRVCEEVYDERNVRAVPQPGDLILAREAPVGNVAVIQPGQKVCLGQRTVLIRPKPEAVDADYLAYYLLSPAMQHLLLTSSNGATVSHLNMAAIRKLNIELPTLDVQKKIGRILSCLADKIENDNQINRNLSEQAQAIYQQMFVAESNSYRKTCKAEDYFDIGIGKTPPRKEKEWFSSDTSDRVWISISDMGSCGTYIDNSSEYLTHEAVERFNVRIVPDNTVLLSFKLTVGRIAITVGETTTNEAIAHFKTGKGNIVEYLYCYLKAFDFGALGSTSSIGTAVNSKTIKAMEFVVPEEKELQEFYDIVKPMFEQIKTNQFENQRLIRLRDSLLPKLMSGDLDVSTLGI